MSLSERNWWRRLLRLSRIDILPIRVRGGIARGAQWTLFPWTSYWRGTYEPAVQAALQALNRGDIAGWTCWDFGAHFGLYSIGLARRVGPRGQVAAFEPNPRSYARLERHRRMNGLTWLLTYQAAVSDRPGTAEFYTYGDLDSTYTHLPYDGESRQTACQPIAVRTLCLDDLVQARELRPPNFVKIDVEGHGHRALAGMAQTLRRHRPIIIAGFHHAAEADQIRALLEPLSYEITGIVASAAAPGTPAVGDFLLTPRR